MKKFDTLDDFISAVVKEAKKRSKYKSICIDTTKEYFDRNDFEGAVEMAIVDTAYWEGNF